MQSASASSDATRLAEGRPVMPWDLAPLGLPAKFGLYAAIVALACVVALAATLIICGIALLIERWAGRLESIGVLWAGIAVGFGAVWGMLRCYRILKLRRLERLCAKNAAPLWLMPACLFRNYRGPGIVDFVPSGISVRGVLGPDLLMPLLIVLAVNAFSLVFFLFGGGGVFVGGGATLAVMLIYVFFGRKEQPIEINTRNLAAIKCSGPRVTIRFSKAPVHGLKKVGMYISEPYRREFFSQLEAAFPGLLPESYCAAVSGAADKK